MIITISGKAGSGKGTISDLIKNKMSFKKVSIGDIKRELAKKMGINIMEFNLLGEKNPKEFDLKYEEYQKSLDLNDNIVLESRLSFYCQPLAFKVFLDVDIKIASERIFLAKRNTDNYNSLKDVMDITILRNEKDRQRFIDLYGIDCFDYGNFNLVIDTSYKSPEKVYDEIKLGYMKFLENNNIK